MEHNVLCFDIILLNIKHKDYEFYTHSKLLYYNNIIMANNIIMTLGSHENQPLQSTLIAVGSRQQIQLQPHRNLASASCKDYGNEGIFMATSYNYFHMLSSSFLQYNPSLNNCMLWMDHRNALE